MDFSKMVINASAKCKPLLVKIIPIEWLRSAKDKLVNNKTEKLKNIKIQGFEPGKYKNGINLIGCIKAETGLGQSSRLVADIINNTGIDFSICNYCDMPTAGQSDTTYDYKISDKLDYNINLLHINAGELTVAYMQMGKKVWDYRYNIAFWLWELEEFPEEWTGCIGLVDEIWTPSEFVSQSIRKRTDKPVYTIPYAVTAPTDEAFDRKYFGLPEDRFLFFMMYSSISNMERKNPISVLEAFKEAFDKDNCQVGLVIKIGGLSDDNEINAIKACLEGYTNIYFITDNMSKVEVNSLVKCSDVLVSLHRSEGFGLGMAEAMLVGTPVIATNWSSNTEFMNSEVACMVDYKIVELQEDIGLFKKGSRWAQADISHAAMYMRRLYEDREFGNNMADKAQKYIKNKLSMNTATELMQNRINEIYSEHKER